MVQATNQAVGRNNGVRRLNWNSKSIFLAKLWQINSAWKYLPFRTL